MNDLIYTVNRDTRTVECRVQNCKRDFMRITDKILSQYPEYLRYFYRFIAVYHCEKSIKEEYVGKSVCCSGDVFNERYGKDVARTKGVIKRESAFQSVLQDIFNDISILMDINCNIDRDNVLGKHLDNLDNLMDYGISLARIKGYHKADDVDECDDFSSNNDYTPHCCSLCGQTFLNYKDDMDYTNNEDGWSVLTASNGRNVEICPRCQEAVARLMDQ